MPSDPDLLDDLNLLLREQLHIEVPTNDTDLIESGLLDSLQLVQLLLRIEERLGARIPLDAVDLDDLRSVERIAALISRRAELERA